MDRLLDFIGNHWIMVSAVVVVAILLIQDLIETLMRKHKLATPAIAVTLMNDERSVMLDVREAHEFSEGHIEGARHIPLGKLDDRVYELEGFKNAPVIVTCQSGTRAPQACRRLTKLGFTQVYELQGGMVAWEEQKLPVTRKRQKK
jgi:rhodanese-related sulfurtransferase